MLRVGRGRPEMRVVDDQRGGPTAARDIADALWTIAEAWTAGRGRPGVFHFAGAPAVSWADFAEAIFAAQRLARERPKVTAIATADWPTQARAAGQLGARLRARSPPPTASPSPTGARRSTRSIAELAEATA